MPSERSQQILHEMVRFSAAIIKASQRQRWPLFITNQISRSAGSIGANFSEAQDAGSKKDFINKIYIAKKESAETKYWLAVLIELLPASRTLAELSEQAQQFTMLLQKIITTSKTSHR